MSTLAAELTYIKGVGSMRAEAMHKELGAKTVKDLINIFPFRYIDKTQVQRIGELGSSDDVCLIKGTLIGIEKIQSGNKRSRLSALIKDESGLIELVWFQKVKYIADYLKEGSEYMIYGRVNNFGGKLSIVHPEMEEYQDDIELHQTFDPVYPSTEKLDRVGLDSKTRRRILKAIFEKLDPSEIDETLPGYIIEKFKFPDRYHTFLWIHFPKNEGQKTLAQNRIKFEEFFFLQLQLIGLKTKRKNLLKGIIFDKIGENFNTFYKDHLQFELTNAQKRVIKEIRADMGAGFQMNRLLQGDVGSGKTIVALMCMLIGIDNGYQSSLMAPTEILAQQHYQGLSQMVKEMPIKVGFLSGSVKGKARITLLEELELGKIHILIGTHALIEDNVKFAKLGLSITDEQHRFGVAQRARMWQKADQLPPHILVMTATPIPRTLAMTSYGDLDVSVIDELPPGRKEVQTMNKSEHYRPQVISFMHNEIAKGRQIYVVYPLIEESETLDLKNLQTGYERLLTYFPMPDYQISVVHGRMKAREKDFEMERFVNRKTQIMVATTVIEVGVNVPNATVMIIENAERFGLSQLHQLRGRVGRGADQSYCILMSGDKLSREARTRLATMVKTNNGFEIAEADLVLRGPGEIEGTRQSGITQFRLLNLIKDSKIINAARSVAERILEEDPELSQPVNRILRNYMTAISNSQNGNIWGLIS